jgi:hypothetical protein
LVDHDAGVIVALVGVEDLVDAHRELIITP